MSVFTPAEIAYLQSQRLARVATSGTGGQPHVVPVSFRYNPDEDSIDVGGYNFAQRNKYRDVQHNPRVAFVDLEVRVPRNHPLWLIKQCAGRALAELSPVFDDTYSAGGRPSIPPERPLKASLPISLYSMRSERAFCEELTANCCSAGSWTSA